MSSSKFLFTEENLTPTEATSKICSAILDILPAEKIEVGRTYPAQEGRPSYATLYEMLRVARIMKLKP